MEKKFKRDRELEQLDIRAINTGYKVFTIVLIVFAAMLITMAVINFLLNILGDPSQSIFVTKHFYAIWINLTILIVILVTIGITYVIGRLTFGFFYDVKVMRYLKEGKEITE